MAEPEDEDQVTDDVEPDDYDDDSGGWLPNPVDLGLSALAAGLVVWALLQWTKPWENNDGQATRSTT